MLEGRLDTEYCTGPRCELGSVVVWSDLERATISRPVERRFLGFSVKGRYWLELSGSAKAALQKFPATAVSCVSVQAGTVRHAQINHRFVGRFALLI